MPNGSTRKELVSSVWNFPFTLTLVLPVQLAGIPSYVGITIAVCTLLPSSPKLISLDQGEMNGPASSAG